MRMTDAQFAESVTGLGPALNADAPDAMMVVENVRDGRNGCIGSWEVERLIYSSLGPSDIGRTIIYCDYGRAEAGTLTSWKHGVVFARYSRGDTAAGAEPARLYFGIRTRPSGAGLPSESEGSRDDAG